MKVRMEMEDKVPLRFGYLTFFKDRLVIEDNGRLEKVLILISFFSSSLYGLWCVLTYTSLVMPIMYYSGILILLTWVVATPFLIRRTYKQVLFYNEIGKINLMESFGGDFKARFNLRKGKIRLVHMDKNRLHVNLMINKLRENRLKTEFQTAAS